jgi:hypothetical protein
MRVDLIAGADMGGMIPRVNNLSVHHTWRRVNAGRSKNVIPRVPCKCSDPYR